jgi:hypothetical protein
MSMQSTPPTPPQPSQLWSLTPGQLAEVIGGAGEGNAERPPESAAEPQSATKTPISGANLLQYFTGLASAFSNKSSGAAAPAASASSSPQKSSGLDKIAKFGGFLSQLGQLGK